MGSLGSQTTMEAHSEVAVSKLSFWRASPSKGTVQNVAMPMAALAAAIKNEPR